MAELSEDEKQSLDDALLTLDDLYEATLKPDGGFGSEQMAAIAKLTEEAMGDAVQRDCPEKKRNLHCSQAPTASPENVYERITLPYGCVSRPDG